MTLAKSRLRVVAVGMFFVATVLSFQWRHYDLLVSDKIDLVVADVPGEVVLVSDMRKSKFERDAWLRWLGVSDDNIARFPKEGHTEQKGIYQLSCDEVACRLELEKVSHIYKISYLNLYNPDVYRLECDWADVVISQDLCEEESCAAAHTVNRRDGKYRGAHGFIFSGGTNKNIVVQSVADLRSERPWVQ